MDKNFKIAARLIILKNDKILLCEMWDVWWLPGWQVEWWENIIDTLKRESVEELWIEAIFDEVAFTQDYIDIDQNIHCLEYFCLIKNDNDFKQVVNTYHNSSHAHELYDLQWFDMNSIPITMMPQNFLPTLNEIINNRIDFKFRYISQI